MEEWYIPWFGQVTIAGQQYSTYSSEPMPPWGRCIIPVHFYAQKKWVDWEGHSCYRCKRACKISMVNLLAASNCMHPPAPCCMVVGASYSLKTRPFSQSLSYHFGVMIFLQAVVYETQAGTKGLGIYEARIEQWWPLESSMHPQRTFC